MEEEIKELNEVIAAGEQVGDLLKSHAWCEYIEPLLGKMITDIIGGKIDGKWVQAPIDESSADLGKLKYYLGYKSALIDFAKRIEQFVTDGDDAKLQLAHITTNSCSLDTDYIVGGDYE